MANPPTTQQNLRHNCIRAHAQLLDSLQREAALLAGAAGRLVEACQEASQKGTPLNPGAQENNISSSYRQLMKALGALAFLQSQGITSKRSGR